MVLNGNASRSFLSSKFYGLLGSSRKLMLNPLVVVIDILVETPETMLETSARSNTPKSVAKSFNAYENLGGRYLNSS